MREMTSDEIRDMWLAFFKSKGHYVEPSANLIPVNDPTLLWINAGVAALKKYFDGSEKPPHRRITNAQKCIRTNDIENVGRTSRHHTFFEMLGNFSIGDYFRPEVVPWAAELLLSEKWFAFPAEKLYVSYYPDDLETKRLWVANGIAESHMIPLKSNFWEIGEGPCGPDTEIYFDRGEAYDPEKRGEELLRGDIDNDRYIEIWNIVFSQYNAQPGIPRSQYKELPQKNIDTGAGLERFACVMQGVETNFDTDLFRPMLDWISARAAFMYEGSHKMAYRVIADHIRSVVFALADGAVFSNEGRGYVLRRLVRRAARYANTLKLKPGSLSELVPVVAKTMSHFYPYLSQSQDKVRHMIYGEELKFARTLKQGESMLMTYLQAPGSVLSGEEAFRLSDTYGFPLELTVEIAGEQGKKVDTAGYDKALAAQKERARLARGARESFKSQSKDLLSFQDRSEFTYDAKDLTAHAIALFKDGVRVPSFDDEGDVVFDRTNFYAESGGQVADCGEIVSKNCELRVLDVQKAPNKQFLHHVQVLFGEVKEGDEFSLRPDFARRDIIRKNHSAAHLLQAALQKEISRDVHQAGSFVDENLMRFDFTLDRRLTDEELDTVEDDVNRDILAGLRCRTDLMDLDDARKTGAMALFSEKYDAVVRVVSFGDVSKELCAGTHVANTRDIGLFVIVSEGAVAAGVRRIVAYTGFRAYRYLKEKQEELREIAKLAGVNSDREIIDRLKAAAMEKDLMRHSLGKMESQLVAQKAAEVLRGGVRYEGFVLYIAKVSGYSHSQETELLRAIVAADPAALAIVFSFGGRKNDLAVALGKDVMESGRKAGSIVHELALRLSGSGGGKPDMAFGGFSAADKVDQTIAGLKEIL